MILLLAMLTVDPTPVPKTGLAVFITERLHLTSYRTARVDLDSDGHPETLVYARDAAACGSGGCDLYILADRDGDYQIVTTISIVQLPVRALSSSHNGWHDLGVTVVGGGIRHAYETRLRFDGVRYPSNPSVPPAIPLSRAKGRVILR